ncbi:MAG: hypothetical protein V2J26_01230 [Pacificimonas sp.]|jgi:membrane protein implicated in regulation of membrane protease activity|nr:hypothetical protein [Pacificimonas sp.]
MTAEKIALILIVIVGGAAALVYGGLIVLGVVQTLPFGLPVLLLLAAFIYLCWRVLKERIEAKRTDRYDNQIRY